MDGEKIVESVDWGDSKWLRICYQRVLMKWTWGVGGDGQGVGNGDWNGTFRGCSVWGHKVQGVSSCCFFLSFFFKFYFIFKLYQVLPNIKMNPPQVYMCSPSWTLLPPPSPYHPSGSSQCTSPKHPVSCIEPGLASHFIHDILHVSLPFSHIFPPSPSPTESIRLFYTSFLVIDSSLFFFPGISQAPLPHPVSRPCHILH